MTASRPESPPLSEIFARHVLDFPGDRIPPEAIRMAGLFLHDSLCVGAAGARAAYADQILSVVAGWGRGDAAGVLGRPGVRLPAVGAAFVNAFQIHGQEYDCVHEAAVLHPTVTIVGALCAEIERGRPVGGRELLEALVLGCDVSLNLGLAATTPLKFFRPATSGLFGAIGALLRLRRPPLSVALDAFGYGLAFASGTMQAHEEGKPALPVQIGNASAAAIRAVEMAEAGLPGPLFSLDGPCGYLPLFETGFDLDRVLPTLGRVFRITEVSWKPFPSGRASHGAIVATRTLMQRQGLTAERLERLVYRAPPLIFRLVGRRPFAGMGPAHARLCFPFLGALVLTRGTVSLGDFNRETFDDPVLLALAEKIVVEPDDNPDPAAFVPARASARLTDGAMLIQDVTAQYGSPAWPLSLEEHLAKARGCLAFAGMEAAHAPLAALFERFESLGDVREALALLFEGSSR